MMRRATAGLAAPLLERLYLESPYMGIVKFVSSTTVTVTASSTSHAVGSWTSVTTPTVDVTMLHINAYGMSISATDTRGLFDIGIGTTGNQVAIVSNLPCGGSNTDSGFGIVYQLPIFIPANTQIWIRLRALISSDSCFFRCGVFTDSEPGTRRFLPTYLDTYGATTASSRGTNLPTSNTYVEITPSTTQPYRALIIVPCAGVGTVYTTETSVYTLGIGASGSEVTVGTTNVQTVSTEIIQCLDVQSGDRGIFYGEYPQGTRIACKQSIGASYRDVVVIGVP